MELAKRLTRNYTEIRRDTNGVYSVWMRVEGKAAIRLAPESDEKKHLAWVRLSVGELLAEIVHEVLQERRIAEL